MGEILEREIRNDPDFYDRNIALISALQKINIFDLKLTKTQEQIFLSFCSILNISMLSEQQIAFLPHIGFDRRIHVPGSPRLSNGSYIFDPVSFYDYNRIYEQIFKDKSNKLKLISVAKILETVDCRSTPVANKDIPGYAKKLLDDRGLSINNAVVVISEFSSGLKSSALEFRIYFKDNISCGADCFDY